jgi:Zn-dependent protease with chaperone function
MQISNQGPWFPRLSKDYMENQTGLKRAAVCAYDKIYRAAAAVDHYLKEPTLFAVRFVGNNIQNICSPLFDKIAPVNPINGKRHLVVNRSAEKFFGDYLFYPLATLRMRSAHIPLAAKVQEVLEKLKKENDSLLNPSDTNAQFNYRVMTVYSSQLNAFAVPGGGMVVYSQLVEELDNAIKSGEFNETTIRFADGSTATVDLSEVKLEDALAALLGHEMTHAASRHGVTVLLQKLFHMIASSICRIGALAYLKTGDEEYQKLLKIENPTPEQIKLLQKKEREYLFLTDILDWLLKKTETLFYLFTSRTNEYEADITGLYFAKQAGYNSLGGLLLQSVLKDSNIYQEFFHRNFEFLYTHPCSEKRLRGLFAAIGEMDMAHLRKHTKKFNVAESWYDMKGSSDEIKYPSQIKQNFSS